MKFQPLVLPLFLAASLSSIYFLPQTGDVAQSAITMQLPPRIAAWQFKNIPASEAETATLARDTEFSKAICLCPRPGEYAPNGDSVPDRADISVVLSGSDLNNSIHRPERCMPAQGHNILGSKTIQLKLTNGRTITVRRLRSTQTIPHPQDRKQDRHFDCVTYYFFVGHARIEHDHLRRTLVDIADRLIHGIDQRWAYVSVSMWFGKMPWIDTPVTEQESDAKLLGLLAAFADQQINWSQVPR
jgi:hypothetical protein